MTTLDVEVDTDHAKGMVALRFFEVFEDGRRLPVRMQRLYNLTVQSRKSPDQFSRQDRDLLKRLAKDVAKPSVLAKNLQLLSLPQRQWTALCTGSLAKRFRDKQSGVAYSDSLPKAMVYFELACHGDKTLFSAVVDLPNGEHTPWHRVRNSVRQRRGDGGSIYTELALDGVLAELDLPVDIDLLNQVFGRDNQRINTDAVVSSLPVLIDHRLDRVRGPSVRREEGHVVGGLRLTTDGADILLTPLAGEQILHFGKAAGTTITRHGDTFIVSENRCRYYNVLKRCIAKLPVSELDNGSFKLPGRPDALAALCDQLKQLPDTLPVDKAEELVHFTPEPASLDTTVNAREMRGWFEFDVDCHVGDLHLSGEDLTRAARNKRTIVRTRSGHWLNLNEDELNRVATQLADLGGAHNNRRLMPQVDATLTQLATMPNLRLHRGAASLKESIQRRHIPDLPKLPGSVDNLLRPYQREGIEFLFNRTCWQLGALLADDMGLGKTLQVLTTIASLKQAAELTGDVLVVCPASVIYVWQTETATYFPDINSVLLNGNAEERQQILETGGFDIAICSYAMMRNDLDLLNRHGFSLAVLDEAQYIRNASSQVSQAARSLEITHRMALTGTPLENRLSDVWSIMDFLNPGYLGTEREFDALYERDDLGALREKIAPIMLRRRKSEVASDLPPRVEETIAIPFSPEQANVYVSQLNAARQKATGGNSMQILAALTRLRQVCCHPALIDPDTEVDSAKLNHLLEMVQEIRDEGHSILVFSQFTSMLDIIHDAFNELAIPHKQLTGETPGKERQALVQAFETSDEAEVFLLSLKAAGTGLTLTKADYVIIYDPWWNPAAESQAIDRTHRIGQDKPVIAYRFVASGSIEEKILALQAEKRDLFQQAIEDAESAPSRLTADDLARLLD